MNEPDMEQAAVNVPIQRQNLIVANRQRLAAMVRSMLKEATLRVEELQFHVSDPLE